MKPRFWPCFFALALLLICLAGARGEGDLTVYYPNWNVYSDTREECEEKLAELIREMKAEITEMKKAANA